MRWDEMESAPVTLDGVAGAEFLFMVVYFGLIYDGEFDEKVMFGVRNAKK